MTSAEPRLALWSDDPAPTDLLSFDAVAATVADVFLDEALDPVALGLSGSWGSGKTTVLRASYRTPGYPKSSKIRGSSGHWLSTGLQDRMLEYV